MKRLIFLAESALFFLCIAAIIGCEKDASFGKEEEECGTGYYGDGFISCDTLTPSEDLLSYLFKEGTYWVYENDTTGERDSVSVSSIKHYYYLFGDKFGTYGPWSEQYAIYTKSHSGFESVDYHINPTNITAQEYQHYDYGTPPIYQPTKQPQVFPYFEVELVAVHDTLNVNGTDFFQVSEFLYPYFIFNYPNQEERTRYYWANNYGIIKKQEEHDSLGVTAIWNLDNWNIVQ